jgi:glycosyltransferase involved in cell wall biosynthesis
MERRNIYLASRSCRKLLTQAHIGVDLIHAHFLDHGYIGAVIKEDSCAPMVLTVHGHDAYATPFKSEWKSIAKYVFNEADRIITVCKFNAERLQAFGVAVEKIRIIPNGFDEKMFSQIPSEKARNKIGLPVTRKILLAVGSLVAAKGHYSLIDAMSIILKKRKDVMLVIVGDGPLANKLRRRAYVLGIEHNVLLVGRKNHQEIPTWMNASDLFVLPSIEEGFPTVIPEAMACGKPVIASKVGGIPEILSDPSLGVLVNPMDRTEIAESILDALEKKWDSQEIIEHAKKYTWHSLSRQIWNVYSEIL